MTVVSNAIVFYFSDSEPGANQFLSFTLLEAVQAMAWRVGNTLSQAEVDTLNIFLSMHEQNQIDYYNDLIYAFRQFG
jgi:hypothetical protein